MFNIKVETNSQLSYNINANNTFLIVENFLFLHLNFEILQ